MNFFQSLGNFITNIFSFLNNSNSGIQEIIQTLTQLFGLTVTLWIIIEAYKVMAGKSDRPTQDLVWKITSALLFISVATNQNQFLDALKSAFEELHYMMSGDVNLYAKLDKLFVECTKLSNQIDKSTPFGFEGGLVSLLCTFMIYLGFLLGATPTFLAIAFSELTLKLLLLILPITIFALAFGFSKQLFTQWLNMFISNALTILLVGLIMNTVVDTYVNFQTVLIGKVALFEPMSIALQSLFMGIIMLSLVKIAHSIAEKLGTVSIDSLSQSATNEVSEKTKKGYKTATQSYKSFKSGLNGEESKK